MSSAVFVRTNAINDDPGKASKLAKRFNEAMALRLTPEPVHIDPRQVGISPFNRLFSVQQVHNVIFKSLFKDGHDPLRPAPGILCEVREPGYMKELLDHNEKLCPTPPMPPLFCALVRPESLASNHDNVLRAHARGGLVQTQGGGRALSPGVQRGT